MPKAKESAATAHDPVEAERLKVLGNELYMKNEYDAAHHTYSEAIKKDPTNAVLYANRAAVLLAQKVYMDAAYDCRKAVELDPKYAKAWGRLGTASHALAAWTECLRAWKMALDCLPKENLTPAQENMKAQFTQGLAKARVARKKIETSAVAVSDLEKMPWVVASELRNRKMASGKPSCVYVVCYAAEELKEAFKYLDFLKAVPGPNPGQTGLSGNPNCIEPLSNSILTDERMFHMKDPDLPDKLRKQCLFENGALKGWIELAGPAMVREEAVKRQKKEGWKTTRPALAVTIRIWIFQAYFRSQLLGHHDYANEMYARAQEFLEWGRKQWPNASREQRGSIFETSFIRGVKRLRLESMHRSVALRGPESEFNHQDLIDFAQDLIDDVSSDPPAGGELHVGHFIAYWIYPKATALSILGWCFLEKGCSRPKSDPERAPALKTASEYYLAAAEAYPEDEERHAQFLRKHLECLTALNKPLRDTLPVCKRIRVSGAEAMEIWGGGPYKDHLKKNMDEVKEFEDRWTGEIKAGRATMDTVAGIKFTEKTLPKTEKDDIPFKVSFIDEEGEGEAGPSSK